MAHDRPSSADTHDDLVAFDLDGQVDRTPKWWAMIAAPAAIAMLIGSGFSIEWSPWLFVLLLAIALTLILLVIFRGFPRLSRLELRHDGIHLFGPGAGSAVRVLSWRRLGGTHVPALLGSGIGGSGIGGSGIGGSGHTQLRLSTWRIAPPLVLTLSPLATHTLAAAIHEARARHHAEATSATLDQSAPIGAVPCVHCNYDRTGLAETAPCPECGAAGPTVAYSSFAWSRSTVQRWWPALVFLGFAVLWILASALLPPAATNLLAAHSATGLWILVALVILLAIVTKVSDRRPLTGPPQSVIHVHELGLTIQRVDGSPSTVKWSDILSLRVGRRGGPYRMIEIVGVLRPLSWRREMELPEPAIDLLAAAIHRGLAAHANSRLAARTKLAEAIRTAS